MYGLLLIAAGVIALLAWATWRLARLAFAEPNHLVKVILLFSAGATLTGAGLCLLILGTCSGWIS